MTGKILIIDDDVRFCGLLGRVLSLEGYQVFKAFDIKTSAFILEKEKINLILLDVNLPDGNGALYTKQLKSLFPHIKVIILTAYPEIDNCVTAIRNGAADYLDKGGSADKIVELLKQKLTVADKSEDEIIKGRLSGFNSIIGGARSLKDAVALAKRVAQTNVPVLLLGETGTGKELFARAIHSYKSITKPFIAINCSSFTSDLLESELFGYSAGAFTGAPKDKMGLIEAAIGGTLFLDEIGEMDKELQAKFLCVIEENEYLKPGDTTIQKANFRLISATNKNLGLEVKNGTFREDLFYRLNLFTISLPPLRERSEDVLLLADFYLKSFAEKSGKQIVSMTNEFKSLIKTYHWKGNVRELKNIIERSVILSEGSILTEETLPFEILSYTFLKDSDNSDSYDLHLFERLHIQKVLLFVNWDKAKAAKLLNISLSTLYRKIEDFKLNDSKI